MSAYLGTLGRLVPIKCSAQPVARAERYSFDATLEGRRKAQVIGRTPREWEVSFTIAERAQNAALFAFADGEWGIGPFVWVSPEAQVTNMLTPDQASCAPGTAAQGTSSITGPMLTNDGWAGRSITNTDPSKPTYFGLQRVPVLPGVPVTASAYVLGDGAKVQLRFYDAAEVSVGAVDSTVTGNAGSSVRSHATGTPPVGAVSCLPVALSTTQATRPAITWTDSLVGYTNGNGCPKAVIDGLSRTPSLITPGAYLASSSFTIREVG